MTPGFFHRWSGRSSGEGPLIFLHAEEEAVWAFVGVVRIDGHSTGHVGWWVAQVAGTSDLIRVIVVDTLEAAVTGSAMAIGRAVTVTTWWAAATAVSAAVRSSLWIDGWFRMAGRIVPGIGLDEVVNRSAALVVQVVSGCLLDLSVLVQILTISLNNAAAWALSTKFRLLTSLHGAAAGRQQQQRTDAERHKIEMNHGSPFPWLTRR